MKKTKAKTATQSKYKFRMMITGEINDGDPVVTFIERNGGKKTQHGVCKGYFSFADECFYITQGFALNKENYETRYYQKIYEALRPYEWHEKIVYLNE